MGLSGLPDTDGREFETPRLIDCYNPIKGNIRHDVQQHGAATGATDYGAVTIWRDDEKWYQVSVHRNLLTHERWKANSFNAIYECLKIACRLIRRR